MTEAAALDAWFADTLRLARLLPGDVAPGILADRYRDRLNWSPSSEPDLPWIVFDGPSAVGKDTQIGLSAEWLGDRGVSVRVVGGTGDGTDLGPLVQALIARNAAIPGASRWLADFRIKAAAWESLRAGAPALHDADVVLANRGPLSQLVYSAVSGGADLLGDASVLATTDAAIRADDLHLLLSCPDDIVVGRAGRRAASGEKRLRSVDTPEFVSAANRTFHDLSLVLPWVQAVDVSGGREENFAAILRLVASAVDLHEGEIERSASDGDAA
jgi:thymidylate kinase